MKTKITQKIGLKKLTIAKISIDGMNDIKGGSSVPTNTDGGFGWCRGSSPGPGRACIQLY